MQLDYVALFTFHDYFRAHEKVKLYDLGRILRQASCATPRVFHSIILQNLETKNHAIEKTCLDSDVPLSATNAVRTLKTCFSDDEVAVSRRTILYVS